METHTGNVSVRAFHKKNIIHAITVFPTWLNNKTVLYVYYIIVHWTSYTYCTAPRSRRRWKWFCFVFIFPISQRSPLLTTTFSRSFHCRRRRRRGLRNRNNNGYKHAGKKRNINTRSRAAFGGWMLCVCAYDTGSYFTFGLFSLSFF